MTKMQYVESRTKGEATYFSTRPDPRKDLFLSYNHAVPAKDPKREFKVGDRVTVSLSGGQIVDATVTAVVKYTKAPRLQVSYGKDETALVYLWQVSAPKV